jgi:uncharacterized protein YxjI
MAAGVPGPFGYERKNIMATDVLATNAFLVKEHVGLLKAANNFDIYDPATGTIVMECREPHLGFFTKMLRFTKYKSLTPFDIEVRTAQGELIVQVSRGVSIFLSTVLVRDGRGTKLGSFKQKMFSIGGAFDVRDEQDNPVCTLKGKWTGWEFSFSTPQDQQLARVTKKWAGLGRELLTTADNYVLEIGQSVPPDSNARRLIIAAVMCIDMVLKER